MPQTSSDHSRILACKLDAEGFAAQRQRYRAIGASIARLDRERSRLVISLGSDVDPVAVAKLIAVESDCCPFFTFNFDECLGRLEVGVTSPDAAPTLDAIVAAFAS